MNNVWDDMRRAVAESRDTLAAADSVSTEMANLLRGRLRNVLNEYALADLKRELRDFNIKTREWKD